MARLTLFIVATLVTPLSTLARAADQQDLPKQLTVSQAITITLANNSVVRAAQSRLDQASGRHEQSRSPLLPQLELDAHQSYQTINLIGLGIDIPTVPQGKTNPFASMDARLLLRQDLLNIANWKAWKSSGFETEVLSAIAGVEWALKEVETSAANVTLSRQEVEVGTNDLGVIPNVAPTRSFPNFRSAEAGVICG